MTLVKNINGTSDNIPPFPYSSWREFWEYKMHKKFSWCSCVTCNKRAEVGGHVKKVSGSGEWNIVPICYSHNNLSSDCYYEVNAFDLLKVR